VKRISRSRRIKGERLREKLIKAVQSSLEVAG